MSDDIEVHYNSKRGDVLLSCGSEAFARLRAAVIAEARISEAIDGPITNIRLIAIQAVPLHSAPKLWHDRLALLGCGLVGCVVMFVIVVGIGTVISWFR